MSTRSVGGAVLAAALLGLGAAGCGDDNEKKTLKLTEQDDAQSIALIDNPPRSRAPAGGRDPQLSRGDQITFTGNFMDSSKKDVGDLDALCAITETRGSFETSRAQCTGTISLEGGTLVLNVGGRAFGDEDTRGAITGGTGDYKGAAGTFSAVDLGNDRSRDTFELLLPGH